MQEQINAIKQLLETNNITESQIDGILIKALGRQASWESCSTMSELADFEDQFCEEEISNEIRWIMELLWRSRIDLNDAKHHAEIVGLDELLAKKALTEIALTAFAKSRLEALLEARNAEIKNLKLALDAAKKPTDDLQLECDQLRRDLRERDRKIHDLEVSLIFCNNMIDDRALQADKYFDDKTEEALYRLEFGISAFERLKRLDLFDWTEDQKSVMSGMMKMAFTDGIEIGKAEVKQNLEGVYKAIDVFLENGNESV